MANGLSVVSLFLFLLLDKTTENILACLVMWYLFLKKYEMCPVFVSRMQRP
jgi:hypothetical protein